MEAKDRRGTKKQILNAITDGGKSPFFPVFSLFGPLPLRRLSLSDA